MPTLHKEGDTDVSAQVRALPRPFRELDRLISMAATGTPAPLGMPIDVYRAEDGSYHLEADLPGVDPDTVEVTVEHATLTIRAERTPVPR